MRALLYVNIHEFSLSVHFRSQHSEAVELIPPGQCIENEIDGLGAILSIFGGRPAKQGEELTDQLRREIK